MHSFQKGAQLHFKVWRFMIPRKVLLTFSIDHVGKVHPHPNSLLIDHVVLEPVRVIHLSKVFDITAIGINVLGVARSRTRKRGSQVQNNVACTIHNQNRWVGLEP